MYGNKVLVNHGIHEWAEGCDLMFHVGVITKRVFRYEPKYAIEAIQNGNYLERGAWTGKVQTSKGYAVPYQDIRGCLGYLIPFNIYHQANFMLTDGPSMKGKKAEWVVREMLKHGLLSLVLEVVSADDLELQFDAVDLIPLSAENPQVKCDWKAGPRELGGTGNLFIQTMECNPLKIH